MFKQHVRRTIIFTILGILLAAVATRLVPKVYEANLEMILGEPPAPRSSQQSTFTPEVERILNKSSTQSAETERQIISSLSTFYTALSRVADKTRDRDLVAQYQELFAMYNIQSARTNTMEQTASVASIRVRAWSQAQARDIANEISRVYADQRKEKAGEVVQEALAYIQNRIPAAQKDFDDKDAALRKFKEESKVLDQDVSLRDLVGIKTSLETQRDNSKLQVQALEGRAAELRSKISQEPDTVKESSTQTINPSVLQKEQRLNDLVAFRLDLLKIYLPDAVEVKKVDTQIAAARADIASLRRTKENTQASSNTVVNQLKRGMQNTLANVESELAGARQQLSEAETALATKLAELATYPEKQSKFGKLQTEQVIAKNRLDSFNNQLGFLQSGADKEIRATPILGPALASEDPVSPDTARWVLVGAVTGFCLGLLASFMMESLRLRIHTSSQLTELTGLPVSAAVPVLKSGESRGLAAFASSKTPPLEAYRYMTFSKLSPATGPRSFLFTGVKNAAGSFTGAVNFAKASAQAGYRVLLVDGDLVRQGITKAFDASGKRGLSNLLSDDAAALGNAELVVPTQIDNLFVLPGGDSGLTTISEAPTQRIDAILEALKKYADVVIFALPPCDVIADAAAIVHHVDETCLVVSARTTMYRQIPAAADLLDKAGAKSLQIILTDANSDEEPFTKRVAYLAKTE